jgi:hypothetical protein
MRDRSALKIRQAMSVAFVFPTRPMMVREDSVPYGGDKS